MAGTQKDFGEMELAEILKECLRQCKSLLKSPGLQNPIEWRSLQDPRCILAESLCGSAAAPTEIPSVHKTKRWRWQGEMDSQFSSHSVWMILHPALQALKLPPHADSHSPGWDPLAICSEKGRKGRNSPTTVLEVFFPVWSCIIVAAPCPEYISNACLSSPF
ncbi:PREDICTED: uncharacterized protein LOC102011853 isoform X3 [Chinchilla lanigera]|uniref:uncharacterized protein LOC102011853 isoform X3 n=1 Tax=Chinchilla lanigera TaxID=34839 RepID=UPI000698526B|nr:PREDICTED: uncharacterized protein LOC102011853 isoform X3 [Chinchilla lanigera]